MTEEEYNVFVKQIEEQVEIAKNALDKITHIADGKNGNVIFLALSKKRDLDIIVKCAKIKKNLTLYKGD